MCAKASAKLHQVIWMALAGSLILCGFHALASPANDNFINAIVITNFPAVMSGNNLDATAEPGEPAVGLPPQQSLWWTWTAPFTGRIGIINDGAVSSTWLKVFIGNSLSSLTNLISNNLYALNVLPVEAGTTYQIAVDVNGPLDAAGPFGFRFVALASNDNFADARTLTGEMIEDYGDNSLATLEPGDPEYSAGWQINSIWWTWTASKTGPIRVSAAGSSFWAFVHVFTGDAVDHLSLVAMGDSNNDLTFNAVAGTTYRIRVVGSNAFGTGRARVAIYPPVPPNDDFEQRIFLSNSVSKVMGTTVGATAQTNDPVVYLSRGGQTVWYAWTAPATGKLTASANNLLVGVFSGTNLSKLKTLAGGQGSASLMVTNGLAYVIGVDGGAADFRLTLDLFKSVSQMNDIFASRLTLAGPSTEVTNNNSAATVEADEPIPANGMANGTLWYQWKAPANGLARFYAAGDGFVPVICAYQGTVLKKLKRVASSLNMTLTTSVFCTLPVKAGTTYVISVDGLYPSGRGKIIVGVDLTTFQMTSPTSGATISAAAPPVFGVNVPAAAVDGTLQSVSYWAVQMDGQSRSVGASTTPPFGVTPTNLPAGTVTLYAVGTNSSGVPRVTLPILVKVRPINDDFAQSLPLQGYRWEATGYTSQATKEKSEPNNGLASVWWQWTAPSSGHMQIEAQLGESGSALRQRTILVYTGSTVSKLTRIPWTSTVDNPGSSQYFNFNAVGGTTYHIVVAAKKTDLDPGTWPFLLRGGLDGLAFTEPTNAFFREPANVPVGVISSEDPATVQRVDFLESDGYTNDQLIASVFQPPFRFIWSNTPPGNYTLEARVVKWTGPNPPSAFGQVSVRPNNDDFSSRIILQTNFAWLSHRIAGATRETGEPAHNGDANAPSAWWSWTAPASGKLYLSDPTGTTSAGVAIYTGTNITSLKPVPTQADTFFASQVAMVQGGTAYQFAVIPGWTADANIQIRLYPPPPNDSFSNRLVVSGSAVALDGYSVGATRETGEPNHAGFTQDHTVWWSWTAPNRGFVTLHQTAGSWVIAGVYTGNSLASLQSVSSTESLFSPLTFEVTANTTYQIALVSYWGDEERVGAGLEFSGIVTNDLFAGRALLEGTNLTFTADNRGASAEPGEPSLPLGGSGRTLWWSWTAPTDGMFYLRAQASVQLPHGTMMLEAFQGNSLAALQPLPGGGGDQISFHAVSNETYQIRFDAAGAVPYAVPLILDFFAAPPNDHFANAALLNGTGISTNGTLFAASPETNDPAVWGGAGNTVWYAWTAVQSGSVVIALTDEGDFYSLQAFTGSTLANLTVAGTRPQHDAILLNAQAGTTYHFAVAGFGLWDPDWLDKGTFKLLLMSGGDSANDNFANAEWVTGASAMLMGFNWTATLEPNDPPMVSWYNLHRTIWYQWQAPASGLLVLTNAGSSVTPVIGVFLGTNLNQLAMIGNGETPVRANETVRILVDGEYGTGGVIKLGLALLPAPGNDDFEQATPATGTLCSLIGDVRTATGQSDNPSDRFTFAYRDAWWQWTAPVTGHTVITNLQTSSSPTVRVYAGSAMTNLQLLTWFSGGGGSLQFDAAAGISYYVQGTWGPGADHLNLRLVETPGTLPSSLHATNQTLAATSQISSPHMLPDGRFAFLLQGMAGASYQLEYSSDMIHWQILQTGVLVHGGEEIIDSASSTAATRFYRLRQ